MHPLYSMALTSRLAGVSLAQIRYWTYLGHITSIRRGRARTYCWRDVTLAYVISSLRDAGCPLQKLPKLINWLARELRTIPDDLRGRARTVYVHPTDGYLLVEGQPRGYLRRHVRVDTNTLLSRARAVD